MPGVRPGNRGSHEATDHRVSAAVAPTIKDRGVLKQ